MVSRRRLSTLTLAAACILFASTASRTQEIPTPVAVFENKYLLVYKKSDPTYSISLEKARMRPLGGVIFLVGNGVQDGVPENWQAGHPIWIALDDLSEITVFDTLDELKAAVLGLDGRIADRRRMLAPSRLAPAP